MIVWALALTLWVGMGYVALRTFLSDYTGWRRVVVCVWAFVPGGPVTFGVLWLLRWVDSNAMKSLVTRPRDGTRPRGWSVGGMCGMGALGSVSYRYPRVVGAGRVGHKRSLSGTRGVAT